MYRKPTARDWFVGRLAAKVALQAAARGWRVAPWYPGFNVHHEVPCPGCVDGCELDAASGLLVGWDGRLAGFFEHPDGSPAGVIYANWHERRVFPPGALGFQEWFQDDEQDAVGVMFAPKPLV